jgi:hypothetical protein
MKIVKKKMFNGFEKNKLVNTNKIFGGYDHKRPGGIGRWYRRRCGWSFRW